MRAGTILILCIMLVGCVSTPEPATTTTIPDDNPLIISGGMLFFWSGAEKGFEEDLPYITDLGIKNADINVMWGGPTGLETIRGAYDFQKLDSMISALSSAGVENFCLEVNPSNSLYGVEHGVFKTSGQWDAYGNFLDVLTAHYSSVDCYQIVRELNMEKFGGTPKEYAELIRFSSERIRENNPDAVIVFGASGYDFKKQIGREYFVKEVIAELPSDKKYFDMLDIHLHKSEGVALTKDNGVEVVEEAFMFYNDQLSGVYSDVDISFETSSYTGSPDGLPFQSEQNQAEDLIARLNVLERLGTSHVNLEGGIYQRQYFLFVNGRPGKHLEYFEHVGLVWNCQAENNHPGKCLSGEEKQAYFSLKDWLHK